MVMAAIAAALQTVAVIAAVLVTVFQDKVMQLYGSPEQICSIKAVPASALAEILLPLLIYVIFLLCIVFVMDKTFARQTLGIIFAVLAVLIKVVTALLVAGINVLLARLKGISEYAGYTVLSNVVWQVTFLFTVTAFTLFCVTVGSCLSGQTAMPLQEQGTPPEVSRREG